MKAITWSFFKNYFIKFILIVLIHAFTIGNTSTENKDIENIAQEFDPDKKPSDIDDETVKVLKNNNAMDLNVYSIISKSDKDIKATDKQVEAAIKEIDEMVTGFSNSKKESIKEPEQAVYPEMSANGLILSSEFYVPRGFDAVVNSLIKKDKKENPNNYEDTLAFRTDYSAKLKKQQLNEYRYIKNSLDREYANIREVEARLRILYFRKKKLEANIELIKNKKDLDKKALQHKKKISEDKMQELLDAKKHFNSLEKERKIILDLLNTHYKGINTLQNVSLSLVKKSINLNSIPIIETDLEEIAKYSEEMFFKKRSIVSAIADDIVRISKHIESIKKDKEQNISNEISNHEKEYIKQINLINRDGKKIIATILESLKILKNHDKTAHINELKKCKEFLFNISFDVVTKFNLFKSNLKFFIKKSKKKMINEFSLKHLQNLRSVLISNYLVMFNEYKKYSISLQRIIPYQHLTKSTSKDALSNDIKSLTHEKEQILLNIKSYKEKLQNKKHPDEEFKNNSTNLYGKYIYSIEDLINKLELFFKSLVSTERDRMNIQKERFLRKNKHDKYAEVIKCVENFDIKYQMTLNDKKSALDSVLSYADTKNIDLKIDDLTKSEVVENSVFEITNSILKLILEYKKCLDKALTNLENDNWESINNYDDFVEIAKNLEGKYHELADKMSEIRLKIYDVLNKEFLDDTKEFVQTVLGYDIVKVKDGINFVEKELELLNDQKEKISYAFNKGEKTLRAKIKDLRILISDYKTKIEKTKKLIDNKLNELTELKIPNDDLARKLVDYKKYHEELLSENKKLQKEYEDFKEAVAEDLHGMELEELSLVNAKKLSVKKIQALQVFVHKAMKEIITIVPHDSAISGNVNQELFYGYKKPKEF